ARCSWPAARACSPPRSMSRPRPARATGSSATSAAARVARQWLLASNIGGATFLMRREMGSTAENLHDRFPAITRDRADAYALASQRKVAAAYAAGQIQPDLVPVAVRSAERGWGLATVDEQPRPDTTLAGLKTPFRPHGRVTAGNSAGLND